MNWNPYTTLGNAFCIILASYIMVDICTNKKQNIIQYIGKAFIIVLLLMIVALRSGG